MNLEIAALQQQIVAETVAQVADTWQHIVVSYEIKDYGDTIGHDVIALHLKKDGDQFQQTNIKIPKNVLDRLAELNSKMADQPSSPNAVSWGSCEYTIEEDGQYRFEFSYEPPKRLNGILDEQSFKKYKNYAKNYAPT